MTRLYCSDSSCKFNGEHYEYKKKVVGLTCHGVNRECEGFKYFHKCHGYEMNERYAKIAEHFKKFAKEKT